MDRALVINDQMIAWKIILMHGVPYFDYRMVSSLAAVSKNHDAILYETAHCRRKYLTRQLGLSKDVIWHKHSAMCAKVRHDVCSICFPDEDFSLNKWRYNRNSGLYRNRFYLQTYERGPQPARVYSGSFYSCLPHNPEAFFNERSEFCFYGYRCENWNNEKVGKIVEYIWNSSLQPWSMDLDIMRCMTNIKNKKNERIDLTVFLEFPVLLKAFLKSNIIYKEKKEWSMDQKIYAIEGVTIPENYEYHKSYFSTNVYKSFKHLPKNIRTTIIIRYKKQAKICSQ
jgi:hypothetical protein